MWTLQIVGCLNYIIGIHIGQLDRTYFSLDNCAVQKYFEIMIYLYTLSNYLWQFTGLDVLSRLFLMETSGNQTLIPYPN